MKRLRKNMKGLREQIKKIKEEDLKRRKKIKREGRI